MVSIFQLAHNRIFLSVRICGFVETFFNGEKMRNHCSFFSLLLNYNLLATPLTMKSSVLFMWGEPADFEDSFSLKGGPIVKCH